MSETSFFAQSTSPILVVVLGIVFAQVLLNPTNVLTNSQVAGRISPTLTDLAAAVATGFAGAIAITRRDVGDVVPGVAIAISLVPPLAVVGVCLGSGASSLAVGALILFASNVVAMVITSTVVLVIAGFAQESRIVDSPGRGRVYVLLASALIIVAIPMVLNSLSSLWERQIHDAAEQWLTSVPGAQIGSVTWQADTAVVEVLGPQDLPPVAELERSVDALVPWHPHIVVLHAVGGRIEAKEQVEIFSRGGDRKCADSTWGCHLNRCKSARRRVRSESRRTRITGFGAAGFGDVFRCRRAHVAGGIRITVVPPAA